MIETLLRWKRAEKQAQQLYETDPEFRKEIDDENRGILFIMIFCIMMLAGFFYLTVLS